VARVKGAPAPIRRLLHLAGLSAFWFAWEAQWAALLGAALQAQVARFFAPTHIGAAMAVLSGSGAFLAIVSQYAGGSVSDRRGGHAALMAAGTLANIAGLIAFAVVPSFFDVVATFAAIQIAFNIAGGPYQALIPRLIQPGARGRASAAMGVFRLAGNAAGLLAARLTVHQPDPALGASAFRAGLLHLAEVLTAIVLVCLLITVRTLRGGTVHALDQADALEQAPATCWGHRRSFAWLIGSRTVVSLGLYLILPFFAFYLRFVHHVARYLAASLELLFLMTVSALAGTVPAGIAGDRIRKRPLLWSALGLLALGSASLAASGSPRVLWAIAVLLGFGWGAYYAVDWALACVLVAPRRAGALMAIWNIGASAPQVAAPVVGGLLVDRMAAGGNVAVAYRMLFVLVTACVVIGAALLGGVREPVVGGTPRTCG
jgi:MFS family permease